MQCPVLDTGERTVSCVSDRGEAAVVVGVREQSSEHVSPHVEAGHRRLVEEGAVLWRSTQHCVALQESVAFVYFGPSPCHQHGSGAAWGYRNVDRWACRKVKKIGQSVITPLFIVCIVTTLLC